MDNNKLEKLDNKWKLRYRLSQISVYFLFLVIVLTFGYRTLFPSRQFVFFFKTPQASKNNIVDPRKNSEENYHSGKIIADSGLIFDTPLEELESDYSRIKVSLTLDRETKSMPHSIKVKKSYRSFLYPAGDDMSTEELDQKIKSGGQFLKSPLFSYGEAVYIIDGKTVRPFNSVETFLSLGYSFDDVRPANGDEFMEYEKGNLFTASDPHPDGTVFSSRETGAYFMVDGGKIRRVKDPAYIENKLEYTPVMVDEKSVDIFEECIIKESWSPFNRIANCELDMGKLEGLTGNDYQYSFGFAEDFKIKEAKVVFDKAFNWGNLKKSLSDIRQRITQNYVQEN